MRATHIVIALTLAGLPQAAAAQGTTDPTVPAQASTVMIGLGILESRWTASGFVGSNFGISTEDPSPAFGGFGGELSYKVRGMFGAQVQADFAPTFVLDSLALSGDPSVYSYMANAIAAVTFGQEEQYQPYVSGGVGGIQMIADVLDSADLSGSTTHVSAMHRGVNIGAGMSVFVHRLGFRGEARWYRAATIKNPTDSAPADLAVSALLSGLEYWRTNFGASVRW